MIFRFRGAPNDWGPFYEGAEKFCDWAKLEICGNFWNVCINLIKNLKHYREILEKCKLFS